MIAKKDEVLKELDLLVKAYQTMHSMVKIFGDSVFESPVGVNLFDNYYSLVYNVLLNHHNIHFKDIESESYAEEIFCEALYHLSKEDFSNMSIKITSVEELYNFFADEKNFN